FSKGSDLALAGFSRSQPGFFLGDYRTRRASCEIIAGLREGIKVCWHRPSCMCRFIGFRASLCWIETHKAVWSVAT
ncbi:MAG: hypothetical protein WA672_08130, partial [Candidatus Angelobacter sp.]